MAGAPGALAAQAGRMLLQAAAHAAHGPEEEAHHLEEAAHGAAGAGAGAGAPSAPPPPPDAHGAHAEEAAHGHGAHSGAADGTPTLDLRVAAIFSIFAGALLAGLLPIFVRRLASPDAPLARALRTFAGGTILGLALVSCCCLGGFVSQARASVAAGLSPRPRGSGGRRRDPSP
jgi:hypothetical protein